MFNLRKFLTLFNMINMLNRPAEAQHRYYYEYLRDRKKRSMIDQL